MANHRLYCTTAAALFAFVLIFTGACSKPEEKETQAAVPVQTAPVKRDSIRKIIQAQAILYPSDQAAIAPKISAPIRRFYVNRGDPVSKGQLLAELENRDLTAAVAEAKGNYDQAAANYTNTTSAALPEEITKSQGDVRSNKEALDAGAALGHCSGHLMSQDDRWFSERMPPSEGVEVRAAHPRIGGPDEELVRTGSQVSHIPDLDSAYVLQNGCFHGFVFLRNHAKAFAVEMGITSA